MAVLADVVAAAPSFALAWKDGRPRVNVDYIRQTGDGECTFWVKLTDLSAALDIIDGVAQTVTLSTSPLIEVTRYVPLQHPYESLLYASGYSWELYFTGAPEVTGVRESGDQVKLTVRFAIQPFGLTTDAYQQVDMRGTQVEVPVDGAAFETTGGLPSFEPSRMVPGSSYSVTVHDAPGFDETHEAYLNSLAGGLNDAIWRGNAIGTVQYHSPTVRYALKRDGTRTATYSLQFDTKPYDHNYEFDRTGTLRKLLVNGTARFSYIDFRNLFI